MLQKTRTSALSLVVFLLLGVVAPASANAWPFGKKLHLHPPAQSQDGRITVHLFNHADRLQEVIVAGHIFSVMPHQGINIKAPVGTEVLAGTGNVFHPKGALLFSMTPDRDAKTLILN